MWLSIPPWSSYCFGYFAPITSNRGGASSSVVCDISSNNTLGEVTALLKRASSTRTQILLVVIYFLVYSWSEYHSIA